MPRGGPRRRCRARGSARRRGRRSCHAASRVAVPPPSAVPDVLGPGLTCVFCGINPGRVSAAAAAHFANPRNDFWRLLHEARFTPRLFEPSEQFGLLELGFGVTNAALRTTAGSGDLRGGDFDPSRLERIAAELDPVAIAFVGKEAYRGTFKERPELGPQWRTIGPTALYVLPSTSPANAAVPYAERLHWFRSLHEWLDTRPPGRGARAPRRRGRADPARAVPQSEHRRHLVGDARRRRRARRGSRECAPAGAPRRGRPARVRARPARVGALAHVPVGTPAPAPDEQRVPGARGRARAGADDRPGRGGRCRLSLVDARASWSGRPSVWRRPTSSNGCVRS